MQKGFLSLGQQLKFHIYCYIFPEPNRNVQNELIYGLEIRILKDHTENQIRGLFHFSTVLSKGLQDVLRDMAKIRFRYLFHIKTLYFLYYLQKYLTEMLCSNMFFISLSRPIRKTFSIISNIDLDHRGARETAPTMVAYPRRQSRRRGVVTYPRGEAWDKSPS